MLKNQLAAGEYFKVVGLIRSLVKFSLREWAGDGLEWADVLKFLKSDEFQMQVIEILGGFTGDGEEAQVAKSPFDIASTALQAADQIVQCWKSKRSPADVAV
ncbi:MAG: hypothetical protein M3Q07_19060 [Pseudobdellovibrionaceae bacterium]|nr:hypothetical protein [Pseudobdellovibrionaceae bacterium]